MSEEHRFPCEVCGADMRFDPTSGDLSCDHCGAVDVIDVNPWTSGAIKEMDFNAVLSADVADSEMEETRVTKCDNCGAQVEFHENDHATECPFCATPVVIGTGVHRHLKPRGVIPFALSESRGRDAMNDWLGRLWFAPNGLKKYARAGRKLRGIYVPYWTYDADTKSRYSGQRGTVYYVTRRVTVMVNGKPQSRTKQVPKIRWTPVSGLVARFFDDILVLASSSLPKKYTDALAPWELSALEPYNAEYLAGFRAEGYSIELEDGYVEAREIMERRIVRDVKFDIGGDRQRITNLETSIKDVTFKHVLLPVWLAAYKYRGKSYRFVVNGRSGQVQGERPWSVVKILIAVVLLAVVAGAIGFVAAQQ